MKSIFPKFVYYFIGLFVYLFITTSCVYAVGEFQEDYDVHYAISPNGTTIVTQNVSLTNKQTNLYPQKYSILIDSTNIRNIIAYDTKGMISAEITQTDGKTKIILPFNEKVAGIGKSLKFTLRYENTDIAQKNGSIWEVNIPGVAEDSDLASYIVTLNVPPSFGANSYMTPPPALGSRWTKEQMVQGGISAAYGTVQHFDATLSYYLENTSLGSKILEVALPSDTGYQTVTIHHIEPLPKTVTVDGDGNWMAQFELASASTLNVQATISVAISLFPRQDYTDPLPDPTVYTKPLKYWESHNSSIQALAKKYTTPREIYQYVVGALTYDYNRVNQSAIRKGAVQSLFNTTNSVCMEFTDLFIAIARAAGIPARQNVGYAYTTNARLRPLSLSTDVLHAWPEYYDAKRSIWIPVDPTWANTTGGVNYFDKLDFNHITFSKYGLESDYPYPAGFYKKSGDTGKDITITFSETLPRPRETDVVISYSFAKNVTAGLPAKGTVKITNRSGVALPPTPISIQSAPFDIAVSEQLPVIPPFGTISMPLEIGLPDYFMSGKGMFVTTLLDTTSRYDFEIVPIWNKFMAPFIVLILIVSAVLLTVFKNSGLWKTRKR